MKLSACLILRDEGQTIYRCLESCLGFVDEFIIGIDKATKDNTRDEVQRFIDTTKANCVVYEYEWDNDFSKARNEGMDKATGDFILIMDGHEFFPELWYNVTLQRNIPVRGGLKDVKAELEKNPYDETFFQLYQQPFIGQIPNNFFLQPRIYRNDPKIRFGRKAHNTIQNTNHDSAIKYPEIILIHDAPEDNREWRKKQRIEMNTKALNEDLEKNPNDGRALFYLGNTRMEAEDWQGAIDAFNKYEQVVSLDHSEKYQVLFHKAICFIHLNKIKEARDTASIALGIDPARKEAYLALADIYYSSGDINKARQLYEQAIALPQIDSRMFQSAGGQTYGPHAKLADIYHRLGNNALAIYNLKTAYSYLPQKEWADKISEWQGSGANVLIIDSIGSFTNEIQDHLKKIGLNVLRVRGYDPRLCKWADVIWQEWADDNAVIVSQAFPEKCIIRVHGYEAYNPRLLQAIKWEKLRVVICVAEHIAEMITPYVKRKIEIIPNGVNVEKFFIKNHERDWKNIGIAGYMNEKKNPALLLKIIKDNPQFIFNLRIDHQSPFWKAEFDRELAQSKNVVYHARYENLNDFWNQMSGVLSTSITESFSFNIAEGMAAGCVPYIHDWHGARKIWGNEFIFREKPVFAKNVDVKQRIAIRKFVENTYPLSRMLSSIESIFQSMNRQAA